MSSLRAAGNLTFCFDCIGLAGIRGGSLDDFVFENNIAINQAHIWQQELFQRLIIFGARSIEWKSHVPFVWIESVPDAAVRRRLFANAVSILFHVVVVVFRDHYKQLTIQAAVRLTSSPRNQHMVWPTATAKIKVVFVGRAGLRSLFIQITEHLLVRNRHRGFT